MGAQDQIENNSEFLISTKKNNYIKKTK